MPTNGAREGTNMPTLGLETYHNVAAVTVKWKAAKVDWFLRREGSLKISLFVKTC